MNIEVPAIIISPVNIKINEEWEKENSVLIKKYHNQILTERMSNKLTTAGMSNNILIEGIPKKIIIEEKKDNWKKSLYDLANSSEFNNKPPP